MKYISWLNRIDWLNIFDENDMKYLVIYESDQVKNKEYLKSIIFIIKYIIKYCMNNIKNLEIRKWNLIWF